MGREEERAQRRAQIKQFGRDNVDKYNKALEAMNKPCTLSDAVQVAKGVAEDVVKDGIDGMYQNVQPVLISSSLQIELLKKLLYKYTPVTEEEFNKLLEEDVKQFNESRKKFLEEKGVSSENVNDIKLEDNSGVVASDMSASDTEVKIETK